MKKLSGDIKARLLNRKYKNENRIGMLIFGTIMVAQAIVLIMIIVVKIIDGLISFFWNQSELGNKEFWIVVLGLSTLLSSMWIWDMISNEAKEKEDEEQIDRIRALHFDPTYRASGSKTREEAEKYVSTYNYLRFREKELFIIGFIVGAKHRGNIEDGDI
jgi:hypothetical protein